MHAPSPCLSLFLRQDAVRPEEFYKQASCRPSILTSVTGVAFIVCAEVSVHMSFEIQASS